MKHEIITNILLQISGIGWVLKIFVHLAYEQEVSDSSSTKIKLSLSALKPKNVLKAAHVISPFFFTDSIASESGNARRWKRITRIFVGVFWLAWIMATAIGSYNHPLFNKV